VRFIVEERHELNRHTPFGDGERSAPRNAGGGTGIEFDTTVAAAPRFPGPRPAPKRDRQTKSIDRGTQPGIGTGPTIEIHRPRSTPAIAMGPTIENPPTKEHGQPSRRTDNRNPSAALGEDRDHGGVGERSRSRREAANQASKAIVTTAIPPRTQILRAWVRETGRTGCRSEYAGDEPDSSSLRRRRTSLPRAEVKRWSWRANVLSYLATVGMLFVRLVFVSYAR